MKLIDVHAHIQQHDHAELVGMLSRAEAAGVGAIVASGVTVSDSERCVELARANPLILAGTGVHPTDLTGPLTETDVARLDQLAADDAVVVMSEVGIDHQQHVLQREKPVAAGWAEIQREAFAQQIGIARQHALPIVFHVREHADNPEPASAWPDALDVIAETGAGSLGGAAHYFQGNASTAKKVLDAGFAISFGRPLLRIPRLQEIARSLPWDRIVIETDSYPQPFKKDRTKWTEPRHLLSVAECLAELRGVSVDEVAERTTENALGFLRDRTGSVRGQLAG